MTTLFSRYVKKEINSQDSYSLALKIDWGVGKEDHNELG